MGKVGKRVLEGQTCEDRQKARQKLGSLKSLTVSEKTRARYDNATSKFAQWLDENDLTLPRKRDQLDGLLAEYVEYLWSQGVGRAQACDTLAGLQDRDPKLKGHLQLSWRLMRTWSTNEIPNRAPPLPQDAVVAMVGWAFFHGHFSFGVSLLVGFYAMLRAGELLHLKNSHIYMTGPKSPAVISLGMTKGGKRLGAAESVTLSSADALKWLWIWKTGHKPHANLCPTNAAWRKLFSACLTALSLDVFQFRPYSLRRGGATFWFSKHGSLDKLMIAGRWQAVRTARVYINEGLAVLAELSLPRSKLKPFTTVFHSGVRPQHLSANKRRKQGDVERTGRAVGTDF